MAKSKIIKQIARGEVNTETALKQLKLLLAEFPDQNLLTWVNKELTGYDKADELPAYRSFAGTLKGSYLNYSIHVRNVGIPLGADAPEAISKFCNTVEFRESLSALRLLAERDSNGELGVNVPPDFFPLLMKYSLLTMTALLNARVIVGSASIANVFSEVDNRILDILMLLEREFGCLDELDIDLKDKTQEEVEDIQRQISVYIYNDNSIHIGDNNNLKGSIIVSESEIQ